MGATQSKKRPITTEKKAKERPKRSNSDSGQESLRLKVDKMLDFRPDFDQNLIIEMDLRQF